MKKRFAVLVVALVAVAGCSSSTGSSGAVQDDVVASAASSMASPAASVVPSPDGSVMASMPASAVASSAPSEDAAPMLGATPNNNVCGTGLAYACGDTGPGGGVVFYASATPFACGADLASSCNFLEVAPNLWAPNSQNTCPKNSCGGNTQQTSDLSGTGKGITGCTGPGGQTNYQGPQGMAIGTGYANTTAWLPVCNPSDAPNVARAYTGGGMTDWSLPSQNELTALYYYPNRNAIGGFVASDYWSSTNSTFKGENVVIVFKSGSNPKDVLTAAEAMRPVRAF